MDNISQKMDFILKTIDKKRWISFSKDDTPDTFKAKDKLRAFGLIEKHGKLSWKLTEEGYKAIELGGFVKWQKYQKGPNKFVSFILKFWWAVVIPLIVGIVIIAIEQKWFQ